MFALRIHNQVHDYDQWQAAFAKYEEFRRDRGVLAYRIARRAGDPHEVWVELDFATRDEAEAFVPALHRIWQTPRSRAALVDHQPPQLLDVTVDRALRATR